MMDEVVVRTLVGWSAIRLETGAVVVSLDVLF